MKTMLEPRMVAAKIHGSDTRAHGTTVRGARMTPSSQGWGKIFVIVSIALRSIKNLEFKINRAA
jgi:hypothetical protein